MRGMKSLYQTGEPSIRPIMATSANHQSATFGHIEPDGDGIHSATDQTGHGTS